MRASSGEHYIALDHVRALAAFLVFTWHFVHNASVPWAFTPAIFTLAMVDEGHTGVALFMTLSGYLFAKLLSGKAIIYRAFLWNRALRLLPLLVLVIAAVGVERAIRGESIGAYALSILSGIVRPTLPNGGWSITIEFHYYLILPVFLWLVRRSRALPLLIVVAAISVRAMIWWVHGEVQTLAYWTIIGRVDQFALGMLAFELRRYFVGRHVVFVLALTTISLVYWVFDRAGGFYHFGAFPSPTPLWVLLPTIEGAVYAIGIAWYDSSFRHRTSGISAFIGRIGTYSYSIYLLHFFVVGRMAHYLDRHIGPLSNFYVALACSSVCFLLMVAVGHLSFRYIESPFLRKRRRYATPIDALPKLREVPVAAQPVKLPFAK